MKSPWLASAPPLLVALQVYIDAILEHHGLRQHIREVRSAALAANTPLSRTRPARIESGCEAACSRNVLYSHSISPS